MQFSKEKELIEWIEELIEWIEELIELIEELIELIEWIEWVNYIVFIPYWVLGNVFSLLIFGPYFQITQ